MGCSVFGYFIVIRMAKSDHSIYGGEQLLFIPFVYGCVGMVELITGTPFQRLADTWSALSRWEQFILGTLLVGCGSVLVIYLVWVLFQWQR